MRRAILLSENIEAFVKYIIKHQEGNIVPEKSMAFQLKLFVEEYKFSVIASELKRINQFDWDENYSLYLIDLLRKGLAPIAEYIERNYSELFLFSAKLHTLVKLSESFETGI
ncbi:hypothetical protein AM500_14535 [Bacillus sp. FJAT-18017]|nr:hypothetical protein AM500_14535 [Bacillus sp. FJAT-18017]